MLYSHEIMECVLGNSSPHADLLWMPCAPLRPLRPCGSPVPAVSPAFDFQLSTMDSHPYPFFSDSYGSSGNSPNVNSHVFIFLRTLLLFFARPQYSTLLLSTTCALFREKHRGWGVSLLAPASARLGAVARIANKGANRPRPGCRNARADYNERSEPAKRWSMSGSMPCGRRAGTGLHIGSTGEATACAQ